MITMKDHVLQKLFSLEKQKPSQKVVGTRQILEQVKAYIAVVHEEKREQFNVLFKLATEEVDKFYDQLQTLAIEYDLPDGEVTQDHVISTDCYDLAVEFFSELEEI